jgi:hypothetical protein
VAPVLTADIGMRTMPPLRRTVSEMRAAGAEPTTVTVGVISALSHERHQCARAREHSSTARFKRASGGQSHPGGEDRHRGGRRQVDMKVKRWPGFEDGEQHQPLAERRRTKEQAGVRIGHPGERRSESRDGE